MKALRITLFIAGGLFALSLIALGFLACFGILVAPTADHNVGLAFMLMLCTVASLTPASVMQANSIW